MRAGLDQGRGERRTASDGISSQMPAISRCRQVMSAGTFSLNGHVGYGSGVPAAVLRTTYTNRFSGGFEPTVALTVRRLPGLRCSGLRAKPSFMARCWRLSTPGADR